jgi:hypothetical protein
VIVLAVVLVLSATAPAEPKLPNGVTCEVVRDIVAQIGRFRALALALANGASAEQIREAKKCLK